MRNRIYFSIICLFALAACAPSVADSSIATEVLSPIVNNTPLPEITATEMIIRPQGKLPAPSFSSQTYLDEAAGFAIEYPSSWVFENNVVGDRGTQVILLSSPEVANLAEMPSGETRIAINLEQWDPKNDLEAFVNTRKVAWDASGITIINEEYRTLDLGLSAVRFTIQTPDGLISVCQFTALGDLYLTITGEGDLLLVNEIMTYLRPIG